MSKNCKLFINLDNMLGVAIVIYDHDLREHNLEHF